MRYNLGCGNDYKYGWYNVDKYPAARPDMVMDLEVFPWPILSDSADEVLLSHVLEHLGGSTDTFLTVMTELYRICKPGAKVVIRVPDPRHADFLADPTHQRPITPQLFGVFDLAANEDWQSRRLPGTPLGKYLGIDFSIHSVAQHLDPQWMQLWQQKAITEEALNQAARSSNNVLQWSEIILQAEKPFTPGRSLKAFEAVVARRVGGLGDVVMAMSALSAIRKALGVPVLLETAPAFVALASACPDIDLAFADAADMSRFLKARGLSNVKYIDWSPALHGIDRGHEVDSFLMSLGVTLPDSVKGVALDTPAALDLGPALPAGRKRIVLHPGVTDPNRTWPAAFWARLAADLLADGHAVIAIGSARSPDGRSVLALDVPGLLDMTDRLDLLGTVDLLKRCDVLVSGDSGPVQLAGATGIAIVGLYSVVSGRNRLPFRDGAPATRAVAVEPACPFHPCYPWISDNDTVQRFSKAEGIGPGDAPALFARWCINPDRYSCLREPGTLGRVKEAVATLLDTQPAADPASVPALLA